MDISNTSLEPATADDIELALADAPLFFGVGVEAVGVFLEECQVRSVRGGEQFISPASHDRALYIVLDGIVSVRLEDRSDAPLTDLICGQCVGEMSIIENAPPSAYVGAVTDCRLLVIDTDTVWKLIGSSHDVARNMLSILSQRLRFDNDHIVDRNELVEQNRRNAITDALTELHNRYWMQVMFSRKIKRAQASGDTLSLAVVDLDHFKQYNDEFGHQQGDLLLQTIASALRDLFRPTDLIARFGGDEFAILLPDTGSEYAQEVAERVRSGIARRIASDHQSAGSVTVSMGLAQLQEGDILESLLKRADQALYRAKAAGRDRSEA